MLRPSRRFFASDMSYNDEFGSDDDDEDFLAAATQAEALQNGNFAPSPRPNKRRRISRISDQENIPEDDPEYYLPGELDPASSAKNSKYKIHVPKNVVPLPDQVFAHTQHNLDDDPTHIRGAVWKIPSKSPHTNSQPVVTSSSRANVGPRSDVVPNSLNNYFRPQVRSSTHQDDAALAARLQEQERVLARQQFAKPHQPLSRAPSRVVEDLTDLPSDAFSSSIGDVSPDKDVVMMSSKSTTSRPHPQALRGPQTGLKQMTIFGDAATQELTSSEAARKRHAWPMKSKEEAPTHHKLDEAAMATWIYPTNLGTIRDYQFNIVSRSLYHNTLVALPTGLGKTFIAATIMLNYYRWATDAQLIFMAPTKPLIAQQMEACYQIVGIPRDDTILMTGETSPGHRAAEWLSRRVFFMTPQTVMNDLKTGICDPKKIALIVVDEAHKATGAYAYTEVVTILNRFNNSFRVLALTATPGSSVESVQAVINNLGIARVELRTEQSLDIRQYTHEKQTETEIFEFSDEQGHVMELLSKAIKPVLDKVCSQNAYWSRDPMQLTAYGMNMARQKWMASDAGRRAPQAVKGMVNSAICVLASLAHNIGLLKFHGIRPFYSGVLEFQKTVDSGQTKGKSATQIARSEDFIKMLGMVRTWTNDPDFLGHPKLEYLRSVVLNHFLDAGEGRHSEDVPPSATRVMVFVNYRDAAEDICRALKRNEPMIRPHVFVGQANSKGSEGMDQKRQNAVIQDFKSGKYNTLVATSIGEEGLDIGTVDLIVCYDASSSPIRMLQRIGRTGRKRLGRVVLLLMKGKEENDYAKAQDNYSWIQKTIADESRYTYCDDKSPRILPKGVQPVVDKRKIDIPVENSQPIDLNEKNRKGRGKAKVKRPPKKFHMPDGVVTGFVRASNLGAENADDTGDVTPRQRKPKAKPAKARIPSPSPEPEIVQLPFLQDVLLTSTKRNELEHKYAQTTDPDAETFIKAPDASKHCDRLRNPDKIRYVRHGRASEVLARTLTAMHGINDTSVGRMKSAFKRSNLTTDANTSRIVVDPADDFVSATVSTDTPAQPASKSKRTPNAVPKPRGRPRKTPSKATPAAVARPRGRPKKITAPQRSNSYGSAAEEGSDSSPEATPADMRLATQGIDLGSRDTDGEDEDDEEPDSELEAFVAASSDPIEMMTSSLPMGVNARRDRGSKKTGYFTSDEEEASAGDSDGEDESPESMDERLNGRTRQGRRVILDSDEEL